MKTVSVVTVQIPTAWKHLINSQLFNNKVTTV